MKKQSVDNQRKVKKKNKLVDNQHKYVVFKEMVEEKSEKHEKKKKKDFNNNIIALLAIFFMVFSLALNYITITSVQVEEEPIGRATDEAAVTLCLNAKPLLNETCSDTAPINTIYYCQLNYSDRDNVSISFTDNTSFFDVNSTGEIRFMPDITYNGSHSITLTVSDGTSCDNHRTSINKTLNIVNCVEPTWTEFMNPMSTNFSEFFCWDSVDNATIAIPGIGMINYSGQVLDLNDVNLDTAIDLSNNNITVHSELVPVLNRTARNRLFNLTTINPQIQLNGEKCPSSICTKLSYANGNLTFDVEHFTTYSTIEGVTINTWDTSDNYSIYVQNYVTYYGAYAYANGSSNLAGYCNMTLNSSDPSNGEYYDMNYNSSSNLFEYTHYFDRRTQGTHNYTIFCNDADGSALNLTDSYTITNRAPVLISDMPNETWPEDTTLSGRDLDNYFMDPDGDVINFSNTKVLNIDVIIDNTTHRITLIPDRNFYGERTVVYFGTDPFNSSASSNIVTLTVVDVEEQEQPPPPPPAGGGGGAGRKDCVERWECTAFGPCLHTGIRVRECVDLARCGSELRKPKLFEDCVYEASCYDLIMNGDEEGVDCGGRCRPCPTCDDGIKNQGEEDIDCGGPCDPCPTCYDGIQNGDEEGVDCGGQCEACPTCFDEIQNGDEEGVDCGGSCEEKCPIIELPFAGLTKKFDFKWIFNLWTLLIALLVLVLIGTFVFRQRIKEAISHAKPVKRFIAGKKKKEKEEKNIEEAKKAQESALKAIEDKLGEGAKPENSLDILSNIVATYLTNMFKLSSDSTETEIKGVMLKNGVKTGLVNRFLELYRQLNAKKYAGEEAEKEELENLKSRFIRLIEAITKGLVIAAPKKETNKISLFIRQSKKFLNNEDAVNAKQKYSEAMAIYKTLSNDEKKKYFKQVNELYDNIKDVQIKQTAENLKKTTMVVLFLLVFGLGTFFILKPAITGHVILDPNAELLIEDVSEQHAIVGEKFRLKVEVNGNQGKTYYMDNSDLFKIDQRGKIKFTPNIKQAGKHSVVIIVEDQRGIFVAKNFKLMIFEDQEALQDYNNREEIEEVTEEEIKEEEIEEVTEEDKTEETVDQEESIKQDVIEDEIMTGVENVSTEDVVIVNATIEETFNLTEKENETNKIVENKPREPIVEDEKRENNS